MIDLSHDGIWHLSTKILATFKLNKSDYFKMHKLCVTKFNNVIDATPDGYSILDGRNQFTRAGISD